MDDIEPIKAEVLIEILQDALDAGGIEGINRAQVVGVFLRGLRTLMDSRAAIGKERG